LTRSARPKRVEAVATQPAFTSVAGEDAGRVTAAIALVQVLTEDPLAPRRLQPRIPPDLEAICLKCLSKEPGRRYATARDLAEDLRAFSQGRPTVARPIGALERGWRWGRRHKALASLYAVSAVATLLLLGAGFWFSARLGEAQARRDAAQVKAEAVARAADTQRCFALLTRVRERIARPRPGWTWDSLQDLSEAARLPAAAGSLQELRTEAVTCLAGVDVRLADVVGKGLATHSLAWHPRRRLLALGVRGVNHLGPCPLELIDLDRREEQRTLDAPTRLILKSPLEALPDMIVALAFSPDGRWLAAGMPSGRLHVFDFRAGQAKPHSCAVTASTCRARGCR
jgi:hypothetical protein